MCCGQILCYLCVSGPHKAARICPPRTARMRSEQPDPWRNGPGQPLCPRISPNKPKRARTGTEQFEHNPIRTRIKKKKRTVPATNVRTFKQKWAAWRTESSSPRNGKSRMLAEQNKRNLEWHALRTELLNSKRRADRTALTHNNSTRTQPLQS